MRKFRFDVIVGNPPYQEEDGGAAASATPMYQHFVEAAKELDPEKIVMITPSRWFVGGKGLDDFRKEMLNDIHIKAIHDWLTPQDVFPTTNIRGGVSFFVWDKSYNNKEELARVVTYRHGEVVADERRPIKFKDVEIFIRDSTGLKIIMKLQDELEKDNLSMHTSARKPFGLSTTFDKSDAFYDTAEKLRSPVACYTKGGKRGYIERNSISIKAEWVDKWKLLTTRANNIGTELPDDNLNTILSEPNSVCTETYVVIGADMDLDERTARIFQRYLRTKFVRYLHGLSKGSHDATAKTYRFVPMQNFTNKSDIDWSKSVEYIDRQLYKKYGLTESESTFIETNIKEMD